MYVPVRDPAWQRDSILLLAYCGFEDLLRDSATGLKAQLGFDIQQLNVEAASAFVVAICWLLAAFVTGVLNDEFRYNRLRVGLTWILAAPPAIYLRFSLFTGFLVGDPTSVYTDALATLALMVGVRLAEEQGYL